MSGSGHVLIVGAGLGGLALAQGLKKHGVSFSIFERDPVALARAQGYRIKVFPDSVPDLHYLLSPETYGEFEATCADTVMAESTISALDSHYLARRAFRGPTPYTVDRGILREVLLRGLHDDVCWGKDYSHYEVTDGQVSVFFEDGSSALGTLLVGADGGRSRIRRQYLPHHKIIDPEAVCIYGKAPLSPELKERISPKLLRNLTVVRDTAPVIQEIIFDSDLPVTMFVEPMHFPHRDTHPDLPEDYMYWSMLCPSKLVGFTEEMLTATLQSKSAKEIGLMLTSEWDPSVRCLVELQDESEAATLRVISATPELSQWEPSPHVTLLGDAVHVMSPAGGVGAATALKDAAALTQELSGLGGISRASVAAYESAMRHYSATNIERSFRGGKKLFGQPPLAECRVLTDA